jgi:hypothetical protein
MAGSIAGKKNLLMKGGGRGTYGEGMMPSMMPGRIQANL